MSPRSRRALSSTRVRVCLSPGPRPQKSYWTVEKADLHGHSGRLKRFCNLSILSSVLRSFPPFPLLSISLCFLFEYISSYVFAYGYIHTCINIYQHSYTSADIHLCIRDSGCIYFQCFRAYLSCLVKCAIFHFTCGRYLFTDVCLF